MFIARVRMFEGFNEATAPGYCHSFSEWLSSTTEQDQNATTSSQSRKFFEAIRASDNICGMIRNCPSHIIHRSSPLIVVGLWAPASIQFLVKIFATSNWELREKASLSLQTLVSAMEQFAEYSVLCQIVLSPHIVSNWKVSSNCRHSPLSGVCAEAQSLQTDRCRGCDKRTYYRKMDYLTSEAC